MVQPRRETENLDERFLSVDQTRSTNSYVLFIFFLFFAKPFLALSTAFRDSESSLLSVSQTVSYRGYSHIFQFR